MRILRTVWDDFIKNEVCIWNRFHEYWLEVCESVYGQGVGLGLGNSNGNSNNNSGNSNSGKIPVYMIRYEDLLHDQEVSI